VPQSRDVKEMLSTCDCDCEDVHLWMACVQITTVRPSVVDFVPVERWETGAGGREPE